MAVIEDPEGDPEFEGHDITCPVGQCPLCVALSACDLALLLSYHLWWEYIEQGEGTVYEN